MSDRDLPRRSVLGVACGACAVVVTGCAAYTAGQATAGAADQGGSAGGAVPAGGRLASTSEIPVGSGMVLAAADVVISQPAPGRYLAFGAACTHQGCPVSRIDGDSVICECHGSQFSLADGSVMNGPASQPLPSRDIRVEGDQIVLV